MARALYALALGLVGAALVCVAVLLALPNAAASQAWQRLQAALPLDTPRRADRALPVFRDDPFVWTYLCRLDLRQGSARVRAQGRVADWSAAVLAPDERVLASVNSVLAASEAVDLRIARSDASSPDPDTAFPLKADRDEVVVALRVFVPDETWTGLADAFGASLRCESARP